MMCGGTTTPINLGTPQTLQVVVKIPTCPPASHAPAHCLPPPQCLGCQECNTSSGSLLSMHNVPSCPDAKPLCPPPPSGTNLHVVHHLPTSSAICSSLRKEHGYVTANVTRPLQQLCVGGGAPRQLVGCVQGCCCVAAAATETSTCWDSADYSSSDALPAMPY